MVLFGPTNFRTDCTLPLSFRTYTRYFLVPHIASCLIAEDKDTDVAEGWEIMSRSAEVGEMLQSLTIQEELVDKIITANAKRYEKRNILKDKKQGDLGNADAVGTANLESVNAMVGSLFFSDTVVLTLPPTRTSRTWTQREQPIWRL
jgi:hypothetical protein